MGLEPMPASVSPSVPENTRIGPVNWLGDCGFRIQVPPSVLLIPSRAGLVAAELSVSRDRTVLLSTFEPRSSKKSVRSDASRCVVLENAPASSRGPLPEASMRHVRSAVPRFPSRLKGRVADSPRPT